MVGPQRRRVDEEVGRARGHAGTALAECVVVDAEDTHHIHELLAEREDEHIGVLDTIPRIVSLAEELSDLAQRCEQWIYGDEAFPRACRARHRQILGTLAALLDPAQDDAHVRKHQRVLLKAGLAPALMEAAEVAAVVDALENRSDEEIQRAAQGLARFHDGVTTVAALSLAEHPAAQRTCVGRLLARIATAPARAQFSLRRRQRRVFSPSLLVSRAGKSKGVQAGDVCSV